MVPSKRSPVLLKLIHKLRRLPNILHGLRILPQLVALFSPASTLRLPSSSLSDPLYPTSCQAMAILCPECLLHPLPLSQSHHHSPSCPHQLLTGYGNSCATGFLSLLQLMLSTLATIIFPKNKCNVTLTVLTKWLPITFEMGSLIYLPGFPPTSSLNKPSAIALCTHIPKPFSSPK